jgi:hypothetical protein
MQQVAAAGQACGVVVDQSVLCAAGNCVRGACVPFVLPGQPCDVGAGSCLPPSRCDLAADASTTGICQLPGAVACD